MLIIQMIQKQIDHYVYQTNNVLGEGSTGTVYRGLGFVIQAMIPGRERKLLSKLLI